MGSGSEEASHPLLRTSMREETSVRSFGDFSVPAAQTLKHAFDEALRLKSGLPEWVCSMGGMSGRKYRHLINNLIAATRDPRYLEVGSWTGSSACSAMAGNTLRIRCIDNWSEFGGPKDQFEEHTGRCRGAETDFALIESDFRAVDYGALGSFDVYLFDGPHAEVDQYDGVVLAQPALDPTHTLIVDDWNFADVRRGTLRALDDLGTIRLAGFEIRTTQDDLHPAVAQQHSDWHNGYFIAVCRKAADR